MNRKRTRLLAVSVPLATAMLIGCHKSSHTSVSTYEFREEGPAQRGVQGEVREDNPSEYHMVAPGQMASPGEMAPPGRPVVEPRRNP